jgi:hypothetical protein
VDPHLPDVPDGLTLVRSVRRLLPGVRIINVCVADDDDPDGEFDVRLHAMDSPAHIVDLVTARTRPDQAGPESLDSPG